MKIMNWLLAGTMAAGMVACGPKQKAADEDTAKTEETAQVVPQYEWTAFFNDETKASDVATDSTYATTPSGLKYTILTEGEGASPKATDLVTVNYEGRLVDGTIFDSSYQRNQPAQFPLNGVISGWTEGLQLMKEGGKAVFYIPADLAYGDRGAGTEVPPGATLIFTVELLKVN